MTVGAVKLFRIISIKQPINGGVAKTREAILTVIVIFSLPYQQ